MEDVRICFENRFVGVINFAFAYLFLVGNTGRKTSNAM